MWFLNIQNIPNLISFSRVLIIPPIFYFLFKDTLYGLKSLSVFVMVVLYTIACLTDYYDGYFARKYKVISKSGVFLDPLTDKIFNISIMIAFLYINNIKVYSWIIMGIIGREFFVTLMRIIGIFREKEMKTEKHGKLKTVVQIVAQSVIIAIILHNAIIYDLWNLQSTVANGIQYVDISLFQMRNILINSFSYPTWTWSILKWIPNAVLFVSFYYTVKSGLIYIYKNRKILIW